MAGGWPSREVSPISGRPNRSPRRRDSDHSSRGPTPNYSVQPSNHTMAPPALSAELEEISNYLKSCSLTDTAATEIARSKAKARDAVVDFFKTNNLDSRKLSPAQAPLALQLAKDAGKLKETETSYLIEAVVDKKLDRSDKVAAGIKYLAAKPAPVDDAAFNKACGVGFEASDDEVEASVRSYVDSHFDEIATSGGWKALGKTCGQMKQLDDLKWADAAAFKKAAEVVFTDKFGDKAQADAAAKEAAAKAKAVKVAVPAKPLAEVSATPVQDLYTNLFQSGWLSRLHGPGGNEQVYPERMEEHLKATGGKVYTRFPPEPNGYLHIGHSKAIAINFGYAKYHGGHCYLRYDDTNPEAEEQVYFDKILENVRWLGYEPYQVTHSSDNFQRLYDLARELITRGLAYTSNDSADEIAAQRGGRDRKGKRFESKDRSKPVEQSLDEFAGMKAGRYKPGEMALRMKQAASMEEEGNPFMWDIIAYRVLLKPHHRTGTDWCIYPTYDFTHCLCDSFENISHSLCTIEFKQARVAYDWLCNALAVYRPQQREYGRLALEGTVTSKRKLLKLVKEGHVSGWDDPRLYTLVALKRRGVPPAAIIAFVSELGVSDSNSTIELPRFEQTVRNHLETVVPRLMMVLHPIRVTLENVADDFYEEVDKPLHPKDPSFGTNKLPFTKHLYIDRSDFRPEADPDFFRLAPGATVGLLNARAPITYVSHETDASGAVASLVCRYENGAGAPKPKAFIHWVAEHAPFHSPVRVRDTRLFTRLFRSDKPGALTDEEYVADIDPDSLKHEEGALLEVGIWDVIRQQQKVAADKVEERRREAAKNGTDAPPSVDGLEVIRFQALRVAYFALDSDTVLKEGDREGSELVLNLVAALKEDKGKKVQEGIKK